MSEKVIGGHLHQAASLWGAVAAAKSFQSRKAIGRPCLDTLPFACERRRLSRRAARRASTCRQGRGGDLEAGPGSRANCQLCLARLPPAACRLPRSLSQWRPTALPPNADATLLQGVSAMGGVSFFNLAVDTPNGDMALLEKVRPVWLPSLAAGDVDACVPVTSAPLRFVAGSS